MQLIAEALIQNLQYEWSRGIPVSPIERLFLEDWELFSKELNDTYGFGPEGIFIMREVQLANGRVDYVAFAERNGRIFGVIVELDGHEWHERTKQQATRDKARDRNNLLDYGFATMRFTGSEIFNPHTRMRAVREVYECVLSQILALPKAAPTFSEWKARQSSS